MTGRIQQAILAIPALLVALLPGVSHATELQACAPNQATTGPCVIVLDSLGTQALVQTLPFDVPVFLTGTAPAELERMTVHVFSGDAPFRVEEDCGKAVDATHCKYTCYRQGDANAKGKKQATWERADLLTAATTEECAVVPNAAEWRSPGALSPRGAPAPAAPAGTDPDQASGEPKFRLRLPPMPPNEHFVFLIEELKRPSPQQQERVEKRVNAALVTVLADNAHASPDPTSPSDTTLNDWLTTIREEGCEVLREVARAEGVMLAAQEDTLFDCGGPPISATAPALHDDLRTLTGFYSIGTEIESTLEGCGEDFAGLEAELNKLRDLMTEAEQDEDDAALREALEPILEAPSAEALASGHWDEDEPAPAGSGNPCAGADAAALAESYQRLKASLEEAEKALKESGDDEELLLHVRQARGLAETMRGHASALVELDRAEWSARVLGDSVVRTFAARLTQNNWLMADTIGTFLTRQKGYIAADFGFAFAPELETAVPYLGTNIYLRPVNKNSPLSGVRPMQRFSFSVGLVLTKIEDEQVGPLFNDFSLLTGAGVRVTESARLSGGVVWAREKSESSLNKDHSLTWSPYVAVSLDYDVNSLIKWFDKAFGGS